MSCVISVPIIGTEITQFFKTIVCSRSRSLRQQGPGQKWGCTESKTSYILQRVAPFATDRVEYSEEPNQAKHDVKCIHSFPALNTRGADRHFLIRQKGVITTWRIAFEVQNSRIAQKEKVTATMSADTAVLPPWKLALLNKKKHKEAEEQRKKDEDQAYLSSLPPWKRAIVLKHRAASGRPTSPEPAKERPCSPEGQRPTTPEHSSKVTAMAKSFSGGATQQAPRPTPEASPAPITSSTVKSRRASFESDTTEFATLRGGPSSGNTAFNANSSNKTTAALNIPLQDKSSAGTPVANGVPPQTHPPPPRLRSATSTSAVKAKWGSFGSAAGEISSRNSGPAVSTTSSNKTETQQCRKSFDTPSTTAAMANGELQSRPSALEPQQRPRSKSDSIAKTPSSSVSTRVVKADAPLLVQPRPRVSTQPARPVVRKSSLEEKGNNVDSDLDHLPPWKKELLLRKRMKLQQGTSPPSTSAGQEGVDEVVGSNHSSAGAFSHTVKKSQPSPNMFKLMPRVASPTHPLTESEVAVAKLTTPPKQSVTVEQSAAGKHPATAKLQATRNQSTSNSHPAFAHRPAPAQPGATTAVNRPAPKVAGDKKEMEPPVNSAQSREVALSPEQNPKELIPPVFPEVEPWSRTSEEDPAFKALPAWKQALILRRRHDIQLRSCAPEYLRRHAEQQEAVKADKAEKPQVETVWSPSHMIDRSNLRHVSIPEPQKSSQTEEEAEENVPPWKLDFIRNRRLKEQLRAEREGNPAHHQINVTTSSEDDEDEVFTNIDDLESDEEYLTMREVDEVGELREHQVRSISSSSSSLSSASTQQSILLSAEKKRSNSVSLLQSHTHVYC